MVGVAGDKVQGPILTDILCTSAKEEADGLPNTLTLTGSQTHFENLPG